MEGYDKLMKWLFYIPEYTEKSAGIVCCHEFAEELVNLGEDVEVTTWETVGKLGQDERKFSYRRASEVEKDRIAVYPETVPDNPLGCEKVVRLMLNKDGLLDGTKVSRDKGEFIVSFSKTYEPGHFLIEHILFDQEVFNMERSLPIGERCISVIYQGKGPDYIAPEGIKPPLVMLTRGGFSREDLAFILKRSKALYSADCLSFLLHEALLCGCAPVITAWQGFTLEECLKHEIPEVYEMNRDGDFSERNVMEKRISLIKRLKGYQEQFPSKIKDLAQAVEKHFSKN
jgi:O-antigen biosynthesis protein